MNCHSEIVIFSLIVFNLLGENPEEASNQNLVKLHHNLQKTSKSHDSSGTNLQHDQSSGQASAFSAWHSAGDSKLCACC